LNAFITLMTSSAGMVFGRISTLTSFSGFQSSMAGLAGCCARAWPEAARMPANTVRASTRDRIIAGPLPFEALRVAG
jgi:hypothetical protein